MGPHDHDGSILPSYVPQAVLRHVASRDDAPGPAAERLPAALLLIDITGFTGLTTAAARRGKAGTERLSRSLDDYLGRIIDLVAEHGGDITKILGDAVLPMWPAIGEDLATATRRAAACGMRIAAELGEIEVEDGERLSLKVGLCAGDVAATHVGGETERWHFLLTGPAVEQLSSLEAHLATGDLIATPEAWTLIETQFVGQSVTRGYVRIRSASQGLEPRALEPITIPVEQLALVRGYIPETCLARLDAGQADWLGEMRRTTVMFINVRGIRRGSADALELLQQVTLATQRTLAHFDGWLKEITMDEKGTTIVAAFGVPPFTHVDDAGRALEAALRLRDELGGLGLASGIGVATGQAFGGPVGNARRRDFAVLGQHVNVAARLMLAAGDDGVLCDVATHDDAPARLAFERLAAFVLKGMATPTDVYRVRTPDAVVERREPIIGRADELASATEMLDALIDGRGSLVVLEGEPGIGKSRLADEIMARARERRIRTLAGAAEEIEEATPYHAWRPVVEHVVGLEGTRDRAARSERVVGYLRDADVDPGLAPLLSPILSLDLPDSEVTGRLAGAVRGDNTRDVLVRALARAAAGAPLVVLLEDVHWLDSASWSLLQRVHAELTGIMLVVTRRPAGAQDVDPLASAPGEVLTLRLGGLSAEDAVALACQRTGASRIANPVATLIQDRAEGNPLFIEQLTYALRDSGRIVVEGGLVRATTQAGGVGSAIIPDTVQRVIVSRLDQLPPGEAMTIKVASVIGNRFALSTLRGIYPIPVEEGELDRHLASLTRLALIAPVPGLSDPTYAFRHVIAQEIAYDLMVSAQAQTLHAALAHWTEERFADDLRPFLAFLAHHWRRAGDAVRAIAYLERAGAEAIATFSNEEAIASLEEALRIADTERIAIEPERLAPWHLQLGEAHVHMSHYRPGRTHLEAGLRMMGRPAPAGTVGQALAVLGELIRQLLRRGGLLREVRRLSADQRAELVAVCRAYERLAEATYYSHETLLPLYSVIRILNDAERSGSPPEIARGLSGTGALLGVIPLPGPAEWYLARAGERLADVDDLTTHEIVEIVIGFYRTGAAQWDAARTRFLSVRGTARRLGDRRRLDDAVANLMQLEYLRGAFAAGREHAEELAANARVRRDRRYEIDALVGTAYCAWQMGLMDEALGALEPLATLVADEHDLADDTRIAYLGVLALIEQDRGRQRQALGASEDIDRALAALRPSYYGTFLGYAGAAETYLRLWAAGERVPGIDGLATHALARLRKFAAVFPIGRPRAAMLGGTHAWLHGDVRSAAREWRRAARLAGDLDMPYEEGRAWLELGLRAEEEAERATALEAARDRLAAAGAVRELGLVPNPDAVPEPSLVRG